MSNVLAQTEDILKQEIAAAVVQAGLAAEEELPEVILEKPKEKTHGDFATNIAMQLARIAKKHHARLPMISWLISTKRKRVSPALKWRGPASSTFYEK